MGFPRQKYWSWLLFPSPRHLSDSGIKLGSLIIIYMGYSSRSPRLLLLGYELGWYCFLGRVFWKCENTELSLKKKLFLATSGLSCSRQARWVGCVGSLVKTRSFSCRKACGILVPEPGIEPMSCALAGALDQRGSPRDCFLFQWDWVGPQDWFWHQTRSRILARLALSGETRAAFSLEIIVSWSGVPAWCLWIRKFSTLFSKSVKRPWLRVSFEDYLVWVGRGISFPSLRKLLTFKCSSVLRRGCTGAPLQTWNACVHSSAEMVAPFLSLGPPGLPALLLHLFLLELLSRYQTNAIVELTCLLLSWGSPAWPPEAEYHGFLCFSSLLSCFRWEGKYEPFYFLLAKSETV